ncbi:MAG: hypothetical protein JNM10_09900 [Planctomycetia bacterium]|nr:hypothetical protein [Planctomycetia bacterium]
MSSRSPLLRALLFALAFVPVAWGTCPRWVAGQVCGEVVADTAGGEAARCPCCAPSDDASTDGPAGGRRSPTDPGTCPVIQLRFTVAPAPADVVMPPVEWVEQVAVVATVDLPRAFAATWCELAPRDTTGGAPPPRVGTVVLRS